MNLEKELAIVLEEKVKLPMDIFGNTQKIKGFIQYRYLIENNNDRQL